MAKHALVYGHVKSNSLRCPKHWTCAKRSRTALLPCNFVFVSFVCSFFLFIYTCIYFAHFRSIDIHRRVLNAPSTSREPQSNSRHNEFWIMASNVRTLFISFRFSDKKLTAFSSLSASKGIWSGKLGKNTSMSLIVWSGKMLQFHSSTTACTFYIFFFQQPNSFIFMMKKFMHDDFIQ